MERMTLRLWDHTALDWLARCEEEFVRRVVQKLDSPVPDASRLFGQAIHLGVSLVWGGRDGRTAAADYWTQACAGDEGRYGELLAQQKPYLTAEYVAKVVEMYAKEYPESARGELLLNESYLEWPEQRICGVVDRVVRRPADSGVVVRDLKTTGLYVSEKWARQWAHNLQTGSFYLDLAEHELDKDAAAWRTGGSFGAQGPRVETVWIDAIHVDRRGYPKSDDFHMFGPFHYSPAMRAELRGVRARLIARADYLLEHPEDAQKEPRSCFRYNNLCTFFPYCILDPQDRSARYEMARMSGELEEREWNPKERS
jgi:hypothetical protein